MSAAVLLLSPRGWAHVGMALATAALTAEDRGESLPRDVLALMDTAVELARNSHHPDRGRPTHDSGLLVSENGLMDGERLIGLREVARYIGVSQRTIERRVSEGGLPSVKLHGRRVVRVRDVRQWIDNQEV